jgi:hypothetical protein
VAESPRPSRPLADPLPVVPRRNLHRHWQSVPAARTCRSGWLLIYDSEDVVDRRAISALLRPSGAETGAESRHHCHIRCRMGTRRIRPRL